MKLGSCKSVLKYYYLMMREPYCFYATNIGPLELLCCCVAIVIDSLCGMMVISRMRRQKNDKYRKIKIYFQNDSKFIVIYLKLKLNYVSCEQWIALSPDDYRRLLPYFGALS